MVKKSADKPAKPAIKEVVEKKVNIEAKVLTKEKDLIAKKSTNKEDIKIKTKKKETVAKESKDKEELIDANSKGGMIDSIGKLDLKNPKIQNKLRNMINLKSAQV